SGQIAVGDQVEIYPEGLTSRVRGIQIHSEKAERSEIGKRTALNLSDLGKEDLRRGQTAATPDSLTPTHHLDAQLNLLPTAGELKHRSRLRLHLGTDEIIARLTLLDREKLLPGETATVQFALEAPAVAVPRDRFVVRTFSPLRTIGGGVILDAHPTRHKRFDEGTLEGLSALEGDLLEVVAQQLAKGGAAPQTVGELAAALGRGEEEVRRAVDALTARGQAVPLGDRYLHAPVRDALRDKLLGLLEAYYQRNPRRLWMPLPELQAQFGKLAGRSVYDLIVTELERDEELLRVGKRVRTREREIPLTDQEGQWVEWLETQFREGGFEAPAEDELRERLRLAPPIFAGLMTVLLEQERLVRLSDKVTLHAEPVARAREAVTREIAARGSLSVAQLRDAMGISRKYALALLECFDATGLTRREGDARVLTPRA
ncbi:MAG: SelB C-terminal domain-containing protein, partial [Armatimonadota bacterium]